MYFPGGAAVPPLPSGHPVAFLPSRGTAPSQRGVPGTTDLLGQTVHEIWASGLGSALGRGFSWDPSLVSLPE